MRPRLGASKEFVAGIVVAMAVLAGCANWRVSEATSSGSNTPLAKVGQSPHLPLIEISFVGIKSDDQGDEMADGIWQWVDETKIDPVKRHRLMANGIRAGFVTNEDQFRRRLAGETIQSNVVDQFLGEAAVKSDLSHGNRQLPLRFGRRYELPVRQSAEGSEVILLRLDGGPIGRTLLRPQPIFAITAERGTSSNQIELQFRPEIQHGDAKQKWITSDSAFRIDTRRESWSLAELDLDVVASAGDLLVVSADTPAHGLGKQMLTGTSADQSQQQVLLLIEVIQVGTH